MGVLVNLPAIHSQTILFLFFNFEGPEVGYNTPFLTRSFPTDLGYWAEPLGIQTSSLLEYEGSKVESMFNSIYIRSVFNK